MKPVNLEHKTQEILLKAVEQELTRMLESVVSIAVGDSRHDSFLEVEERVQHHWDERQQLLKQYKELLEEYES